VGDHHHAGIRCGGEHGVDDRSPSLRIKVSSRFVSKQKGRALDQGSRYGNALPLAARELVRVVVTSRGETNLRQHLARSLLTVMTARTRIEEGFRNVIEGSQSLQ
jgi:hypothetical protein